ncbi:SCO6745 family protein [Streptomyces sp. t39]|uniref:SCO6745 family protein n=1 Tax=Streptomyces sp. t39 TaxID=1828156 RepID=UPI0011CD4E5D|nr:hypothetical protein [Streptomyces sp. t39]TXS58112.1 hypothetical protein EAO77_00635 [Streptomyces sp. t39]
MTEDLGHVRRMWHLLEPLHAVLYYAPQAYEQAAALGFDVRERWPGYFAWRAAPLGEAGADEVGRAFHSFSPRMVERYVPGAWKTAPPAEVLAARLRAVDLTYRAVLGEAVGSDGLAEAAALARRAAEGADTAGRPLAASNAALPWPQEPHLMLWQAATVLREHRGDGHVAALLDAGLDPVESLVSFAAVGAAPVETFASRGWSDAEWGAAAERLVLRGLLDADGSATDAGRALRSRVEERTDAAAAAPWAALGPDATARLAELLGDLWVAVLSTGLLPATNTLGIGRV